MLRLSTAAVTRLIESDLVVLCRRLRTCTCWRPSTGCQPCCRPWLTCCVDPALDAVQTAENLYLPEDQRRLPALLQTMAHLRTYLDRPWAPDKLLRLGNFIWNRYRAVKTDIVVQFMKVSAAVM